VVTRPSYDYDLRRLTLLRDIVRSARDPQGESFPLLELAEAIRSAPITPEALRRRFGQREPSLPR
jgi:hypothetical protein